MRRLVIAALLSAPFAAFAAGSCKFEAPRNLPLDLSGVRSVQIEVRSYDLHLAGAPAGTTARAVGRACASEQVALDRLTVTQRRDGDRLRIDLGGEHALAGLHLFGGDVETSLDVTVTLPSTLPVTVNVGSGDADVRGVQELTGTVGSGNLDVRQVAGKFASTVGSGEIEAMDVGSLELGSVGSGAVKTERVRGDARIGNIGSGDVTLRAVGGSVRVETLGSGDLSVRDVGGDLSLGIQGSGDVDHSGVKGKVSLPRGSD